MSVETLPAVVQQPVDDGDNLVHTFCCDPMRSLCGLDFDDDDVELPAGDYANDCLVCEDLARGPCDCPTVLP